MKQTVTFGSRSFSNDKLEGESFSATRPVKKSDENVEDL